MANVKFIDRAGYAYARYLNEDGDVENEVRICRKIDVVNRFVNMDTNESYLKLILHYETYCFETDVPNAILERRSLEKFANENALDLHPSKILLAVSYLNAKLRKAAVIFTFDKLQMLRTEDDITWQSPYGLITCSEDTDGIYTGNDAESFHAAGNLDDWIAGFTELIMPYPHLLVVMIAAFSAPLINILASQLGCQMLIVEIVGPSSCGKSTALTAAASAIGNPDIAFDIVRSLNCTINGFIAGLRSVIPNLYDEATGSNLLSENVLYSVVTGKSKSRLNSQSQIIGTTSFSGLFMYTSETRKAEMSSDFEGILLRTLTLESNSFTCNAEHSDRLVQVFMSNHGHIFPAWLKYLACFGKSALEEQYSSTVNFVTAEFIKRGLPQNAYTSRRCKVYGVLLLALQLFAECFDMQIPNEGILGILAKDYTQLMQKLITEKCIIDRFLQAVLDHRNCFATVRIKHGSYSSEDSTFYSAAKQYGTVQRRKAQTLLQVKSESFRYLCSYANIDQGKLLSELESKGILCHNEKARLSTKICVGNVYVRGYSIDISAYTDNIMATRKTSSSNIDELSNL